MMVKHLTYLLAFLAAESGLLVFQVNHNPTCRGWELQSRLYVLLFISRCCWFFLGQASWFRHV